jgi:hypothetical protein
MLAASEYPARVLSGVKLTQATPSELSAVLAA